MLKQLSLFFLAFSLALPLLAQESSLDTLERTHQAKLERTLAQIAQQRERIAQERIPLARSLRELETQARELRKEAAAIQRRRDSMSVDLDTLRTRIEAEQKEIDYLTRSLIPDYLASWDASLSAGERATTGEALRAYYLGQDQAERSPVDKLHASLDMIEDSLEHLNQSIGGRLYAGQALNEDDTLEEARYAQFGPLLYAHLPQSKSAGALQEGQTDYPRLITLSSANKNQIIALVEQGAGTVPVDPTLGDAQALEQTRDSLLEHLEKGGIWVYPILLFALVATVIAVLKAIQIFGISSPDFTATHALVLKLRSADKAAASKLAKSQPEPTRAMLEAAADNAGESPELIEEIMYEHILATQPKLERFLNVIAVTAATAPLLGLLGTVTGIIKTFELMSLYGAGDPKPLISGISEALITTELGLILAIPALVLHALLSRRTSGILARMEQTATTVVNGISRKNLSPPKDK